MKSRMRRGSDNVFSDLGFGREEAEHLRIRSDLMISLSRVIQRRGLTQVQAAGLLGVSQPRISDLTRGKIDRFSIDTLVAMLGQAGLSVHFTIRPSQRVA
ncbi:MAG: helix-turn-helix domain-containing protein [Gemmatimonadales bacterium]